MRVELGEPEVAVFKFKVSVRRNDVDPAGLNFHTVADRMYCHLSIFLQQLGQDAAVAGIQVRNHDKCHLGKFIGHGREKRFNGLKTPGRGADADDGERLDFFLLFIGFEPFLSGRHVW